MLKKEMQAPIVFFWFRRDLRLHDNAGLYHALRSGLPVLPVFIFDTDILDDLPTRRDARVEFIHRAVSDLHLQLQQQHGSTLLVAHGRPTEIWASLLAQYQARAVYTNRDYEPYAVARDASVQQFAFSKGIDFQSFKDHVVFEKDEVLKDDGSPYTVFTPYSRKWKTVLESRSALGGVSGSFYLQPYQNEEYAGNFLKTPPLPLPGLAQLGFEPAGIPFPPEQVSRGLIRTYHETRDFPGIDGTSRLGVHFRFGTVSIREKARHAVALNPTYLNELIWRDFYSQILAHFPHVVHQAFKPVYDRLSWREAPAELEAWKNGQTGYPLVDAGMRQLNATGYMHNRVRMVAASFLVKHLLIDWRVGEAYFGEKLLDFDLASNNGGWQWAAGTGTDAAPYFRVFNPSEQQRKFDPEGLYVRRWVPEYGTPAYPQPIVEHAFARQRALQAYKAALGQEAKPTG